ncbi:MAG: ketopantoate reductase family protein [Candidatus Binatia bacterium]
MDSQRWRIAVMGAGAVGGYFGARLAAGDHEVAFIARRKQVEAMRRDGLKVKSILGDFHIRSLFASDPEEIGAVDLILLCVKSYDTQEAAAKLAPLVRPDTIILSLQNGVDNPEKIASLWGRNRTLAGVVYIGARVVTPGTIEHVAAGRITLGELDGGASERTKTVHRLFAAAQIPCTISTEIRKVLWGKLVWNAPFCAISCLTRATVTEILASDPLRELAIDCMEEVREAARCKGIDLGPSIVAETLSLSQALGDFKPSMLQDLEAGKPLEHEAFNGVVANALREAGKEAPINRIFYATLQFLDEKIRQGAASVTA